ncbi:unnamed protein product [Sphagnum balticum]
MTRSISRSPSHKVRRRSPARSPSPARDRHSSRTRQDRRSRSPAHLHGHGRWQQEAELKLIEEGTARRVEEAIRKKVNEALNSEEVKKEIEAKIKEGRNKLFDEIAYSKLQQPPHY